MKWDESLELIIDEKPQLQCLTWRQINLRRSDSHLLRGKIDIEPMIDKIESTSRCRSHMIENWITRPSVIRFTWANLNESMFSKEKSSSWNENLTESIASPVFRFSEYWQRIKLFKKNIFLKCTIIFVRIELQKLKNRSTTNHHTYGERIQFQSETIFSQTNPKTRNSLQFLSRTFFHLITKKKSFGS